MFEGNVIIVKPTASIDERKDIKKFAIKEKLLMIKISLFRG
ncbi:MAG: hypothetical protein ACLTZT_01495 [Butyricimonas faecalis]